MQRNVLKIYVLPIVVLLFGFTVFSIEFSPLFVRQRFMLFQPFTCINRHCVSEMANNYRVNRVNGGSVAEIVCASEIERERASEQEKG